uniref:Uncharacterized protein n=1 Tax=Aegilops tauschii TaxID=37682 RepID=M8CPP7_AEGTA
MPTERKRRRITVVPDDKPPVYLVVEHEQANENEPAHSILTFGTTRTPRIPLQLSQRGMSRGPGGSSAWEGTTRSTPPSTTSRPPRSASPLHPHLRHNKDAQDPSAAQPTRHVLRRHGVAVDVAAGAGVPVDRRRGRGLPDPHHHLRRRGLQGVAGPLAPHMKMDPVLVPLRGRLYVLSRRPSVKRGAFGLDYLPWFEQISFEDGRPRCAEVCKELEPPPVFPCRITPPEYRDPPPVRIASYATVGSHILLSVAVHVPKADRKKYRRSCGYKVDMRKYKGTCGYDVDRGVWEMLHEKKNLPFRGRAVPLGLGGGQLFLARSKERGRGGPAAVYRMHVQVGQSASGTRTSEVCIAEVPLVVPEGRRLTLGELVFPLERGRFSCVYVPSVVDPSMESKLRVVRRTYSNGEGG